MFGTKIGGVIGWGLAGLGPLEGQRGDNYGVRIGSDSLFFFAFFFLPPLFFSCGDLVHLLLGKGNNQKKPKNIKWRGVVLGAYLFLLCLSASGWSGISFFSNFCLVSFRFGQRERLTAGFLSLNML